MAQMSATSMSLSSHFDDVFRRATKLITSSGIEPELLGFLESVEQYRIKWREQKSENETLRKRVKHLEEELQLANTKILQFREVIEKEVHSRQEAEKARQNLVQVLNCVRDILSKQEVLDDETKEKLASLGSPLCLEKRRQSPGRLSVIEEYGTSLSDVSFDRTDFTLDSSCTDQNLSKSALKRRARRKRKNNPAQATPKKRKSSLDHIDCPENFATPLANSTTLQLHPDPAGDKPEHHVATDKENSRNAPNICASDDRSRPVTRQLSRVAQDDLGTTGPFQMQTSQTHLAPEAPTLSRTPSCTEGMRYFTSSSKLNNRPHAFVSKVIMGLEQCQQCQRRFKFYTTAMRCQDCKAVCHVECKRKIPLPCVPTVATPSGKSARHTISDYTPSTSPMIPPIIIYCCSEIESRGMNDVGLYRLSGAVQEVKEWKEKILKGKGTPNLAKLDIHLLCSIVKKFLSDLHEPLITRSLWGKFVTAAEIYNSQGDDSDLFQAISLLPQPNRDTLSYLILHLKRVAESPECLMPAENIARIFGPTLLGYSVPDPSPTLACQETGKQAAVVKCLLQISREYWSNMIKFQDERIFPSLGISPDLRQKTLKACTSGNVAPSPGTAVLGRTPVPLRQKKALEKMGKRRPFFDSPAWK